MTNFQQNKKIYKNPYTVLEKVKKGEIKSYYRHDYDDYYDRDYTGGGGLFQKLKFYQRPELVKPYLHYIDESRLRTMLNTQVTNPDRIKKNFEFVSKFKEIQSLDKDKRPDFSQYQKAFTNNYKEFPEHLKNDIFQMYYNKIDDLEFSERNEKNYTKFKFLERANNPVGKIMSNHGSFKSAIFTRNIIEYFISRLTLLEYVDPEKANDLKRALKERNVGSDRSDDCLDSMNNTESAEKLMNHLLNEATDICKNLDGLMSDDLQEALFKKMSDPSSSDLPAGAGKFDTDYIKSLTSKLESLTLSMGGVKDKIKKILDRSMNYFSSKKELIYEDFFNSDNLAGLENYELLHPKIRNLFIEDLLTKDIRSIGKIDLYIDVSGSMSSSSGCKNKDGMYISKMDFAKAFAAKLKELNLLDNIYLFNNSVKKYGNELLDIALIDCSGGTTINKAVLQIERNKNNALIITDAEDFCSAYSEKAFFVGVKGAQFWYFNSDTLKKYSENDQIIIFDGSRIYNIDSKGKAIV